jgi:hypothetical protein
MRCPVAHQVSRKGWQLLRGQGHGCHLPAAALHSQGAVLDASVCTYQAVDHMSLVHWGGMGPSAAGGHVISMLWTKTFAIMLFRLDHFLTLVHLYNPQLRPPACMALARVQGDTQVTQAQLPWKRSFRFTSTQNSWMYHRPSSHRR